MVFGDTTSSEGDRKIAVQMRVMEKILSARMDEYIYIYYIIVGLYKYIYMKGKAEKGEREERRKTKALKSKSAAKISMQID